MTIALIYPPTCDPTAPYLSLPALTAWLRAHGKKVLPIDANVEAYDKLLQGEILEELIKKIRAALGKLDKKPFLDHRDQLCYARLRETEKNCSWVPGAMDDAVAGKKSISCLFSVHRRPACPGKPHPYRYFHGFPRPGPARVLTCL